MKPSFFLHFFFVPHLAMYAYPYCCLAMLLEILPVARTLRSRMTLLLQPRGHEYKKIRSQSTVCYRT